VLPLAEHCRKLLLMLNAQPSKVPWAAALMRMGLIVPTPLAGDLLKLGGIPPSEQSPLCAATSTSRTRISSHSLPPCNLSFFGVDVVGQCGTQKSVFSKLQDSRGHVCTKRQQSGENFGVQDPDTSAKMHKASIRNSCS
jgi:hypothetical protein